MRASWVTPQGKSWRAWSNRFFDPANSAAYRWARGRVARAVIMAGSRKGVPSVYDLRRREELRGPRVVVGGESGFGRTAVDVVGVAPLVVGLVDHRLQVQQDVRVRRVERNWDGRHGVAQLPGPHPDA